MSPECPRCHSPHITMLNYGKTLGGMIGAMGSFLFFLQTGTPRHILIAAPAEALPVLFRHMAIGYAVGAAVGAVIDTEFIDSCKCLTCGHSFSPKSTNPLNN